jgi:hypothetical protein
MLEVYPKAVAELAPEHFGSLMATLEWGVLGSDMVAVHCSLEGLAGLAKYQHACLQSGSSALAGQSAGEAGGRHEQQSVAAGATCSMCKESTPVAARHPIDSASSFSSAIPSMPVVL